MPTYQYKCRECENEFEEFQKISDPPIEKCPVCGGKADRIITGGAGFVLKGSGFYTTDYRPSSYKEAEKKEKEAPKTEIPDSKSNKSDKKDVSAKKE